MEKEIRKVVELGKGLTAMIVIKRAGQEPAWLGDRVITRAEIHLPTENWEVNKELRFGNRLKVANKPLDAFWGHLSSEGNYRYEYQHFLVRKWREGFAQAEAWAAQEIGKLIKAVKRREKALANAEG